MQASKPVCHEYKNLEPETPYPTLIAQTPGIGDACMVHGAPSWLMSAGSGLSVGSSLRALRDDAGGYHVEGLRAKARESPGVTGLGFLLGTVCSVDGYKP
eukprot:s1802_g7.t1